MSFKNLATLFEEKATDLYKHDPSVFTTGEPLYLNKLKPEGMSSDIKHDSRSLPITSTLRDAKRFVKYSLSTDGILFLANQQLMQTGNTLAYTSIINPAFIISNTVPFVRAARHLSGVGIFSPDMSKVAGRMQKSTGEAAKSRANPSLAAQNKAVAVRSNDKSIFKRLRGGIEGSINNVQSNLDPNSTVYEENTRPDIDYFDRLKAEYKEPEVLAALEQTPESILKIPTLANPEVMAGVKNYKDYRDIIRATYAEKFNKTTGKKEMTYFNDQEMSSNIGAPFKAPGSQFTDEQKAAIYKFTADEVGPKDFIDVFINVPSKRKKVKFRSFMKNLKTSVKPEYNSSRYLGRTDKYITYAGATRSASFELTLLAFSQEEINGVYGRVNYLQGLAFPLGLAKGQGKTNLQPQLLQPPMVTLTIGKIFRDQPGYMESIEVAYSDTYDIDAQIPMIATVNIKYAIIEKEVMFYDSPNIGRFEINQLTDEQVTQVNNAVLAATLGPGAFGTNIG